MNKRKKNLIPNKLLSLTLLCTIIITLLYNYAYTAGFQNGFDVAKTHCDRVIRLKSIKTDIKNVYSK